jgi:hypothetical protein
MSSYNFLANRSKYLLPTKKNLDLHHKFLILAHNNDFISEKGLIDFYNSDKNQSTLKINNSNLKNLIHIVKSYSDDNNHMYFKDFYKVMNDFDFIRFINLTN